MTDGVRPVGAVRGDDRRAADRRAAERRDGKPASKSRDLVPVGKVVDHAAPPAADAAPSGKRGRASAGSAAAFAAQMLGQGGQRNGIKGGPPVMEAARASYLGAQYSGEKERRPPSGTAKRTDV